MPKRVVMVLASLAGIFLAVAGILFPVVVFPQAANSIELARHLSNNQFLSLVYVGAILLSNLLIAPVLLLLSLRLYPLKPAIALSAGVVAGTALMLETVAVLLSLARWTWAIPSAASDPAAAKMFETLQSLWLFVDLPGAVLFYCAAVIYAAGVWKLHVFSAWSLAASTGLFLLGGLLTPLSALVGAITCAVSIIVYGLAYFALGDLTIALEANTPFKLTFKGRDNTVVAEWLTRSHN
ncbi:MAG TPA: hypothetical protein VH186_16775 [Chloroflexia bacterium]|nr:hypothetical protein [Chloroflexia bacterium]